MPLQHIANLTLLAMNRPPQGHTVSLLRTLRDSIPGLALRTTFISGFPGWQAAVPGSTWSGGGGVCFCGMSSLGLARQVWAGA
jgi:hypothetical protein